REIPRYSMVSNPIGLHEFQERLEPDTAFLEYMFGEDVDPVLVSVTTRDAFHIYTLPATARELNAAVGAYVDVLSRSEQDRFLYYAAGERLFGLLMLPMLADLQGVSRLIISSDAVLQRLPFEALV